MMTITILIDLLVCTLFGSEAATQLQPFYFYVCSACTACSISNQCFRLMYINEQ